MTCELPRSGLTDRKYPWLLSSTRSCGIFATFVASVDQISGSALESNSSLSHLRPSCVRFVVFESREYEIDAVKHSRSFIKGTSSTIRRST